MLDKTPDALYGTPGISLCRCLVLYLRALFNQLNFSATL